MLILVSGRINHRVEKKIDVFCLSLKNLYPCFKKNIKNRRRCREELWKEENTVTDAEHLKESLRGDLMS